jgi:hypothetical protein
MAYEVRRSDGTLYTNEGRSLILPTPEAALSRIIGFPLEAAPPGEYELVMSVKDELSGRTVDLREPFTVVAGATPPSAAPEATPASTAPSEPTEPTGR